LTAAQRFILEIDGVQIGTFTEVSGLSVDVEVERIEEGGQNQFVHQRPGRMTWPNIVLKRGVVDDDGLFGWLAKTSGDGYAGAGNSLSLLTGAITLITDHGERLRSWSIDRAFPVKWSGPSFAVSSSDIPMEELEVAHHGFKPSNV
jgi:phage tail-like protein